mmetsp:Transcript_15686/g.20714  ORF Transcript_15686/g.20714 Transcript_15686/m.20714 type:complete len:370 (-) Transcript_15686:489-1598(-)
MADFAIIRSRRKSAGNSDRAWNLFVRHCHEIEERSPLLVPKFGHYTADEQDEHRQVLLRFTMSLAQRFKSLNTVEQYLSLVKSMHRVKYHRELMDGASTFILKDVLHGLRDLFPTTVRQRVGILPQHIRLMKKKFKWYQLSVINETALIELAYCTLARSIEVTAKTIKGWPLLETKLTRADVKFEPSLQHPQRVTVFLKRAKQRRHNPYNDNNPVILAYDPTQPINAAYALQQLFLKDPVHPDAAKTTALFRMVKTGRPITQKQFLTRLRQCMNAVTQLPTQFIGTHSLRIGAISALLSNGVSAEILNSFAGYSDPKSHERYNRCAIQTQITVSNTLGQARSMESVEVNAIMQRRDIPLELITPDPGEI